MSIPEIFKLVDNHEENTCGISVELSNIGASIIRLIFPPASKSSDFSSDIVLHCQEYDDESGKAPVNDAYFGGVVGRVANRIANGRFELNGKEYQLPQNNGSHCLHGGALGEGFSHRCFDGRQLSDQSVEFTLKSLDGDQGFPADIVVTVKYTLSKSELKCEMSGSLVIQDENGGKLMATPINLAQHSYFNLGGHNCEDGILSHTLQLPSEKYTPTDATSIPTRDVVSLNLEKAMDFRHKRVLADALADFAVSYCGMDYVEAKEVVKLRNGKSKHNGEPFGFDHNYVISKNSSNYEENGLWKVGIVDHSLSGRQMTILTDAPGVQLYTSNYLDGSIQGKNGQRYLQWQGICFESQHYPDSIGVCKGEFADGACVLLDKDTPSYHHKIVYKFCHI